VIRTVGEAEVRDDLPQILAAMDQPSIDGINTWFVAKAARECGLKVALSGLGGDELLAGYPSFVDLPRWVARLHAPASVPGAGRLVRRALRALGGFGNRPKAVAMLEYGGTYPGAYLLRRGLFLPFELDTVLDPDVVRRGMARLRPLARLRRSMEPVAASPLSRVAALESSNYMRNQLLRDADWAGMAHSLEIRTPLVDCTLLRAIAPVIPTLGRGAGKRSLATAPKLQVPAAIAERAKTGFFVPTERWTALTGGASASSKGSAARARARSIAAAFRECPASAAPVPAPTEPPVATAA